VSRALITGGAGFIGSHLADRLAADGNEVVVYDDFSTGRRRFVEQLEDRPGVSIVEGDVLDEPSLRRALAGCELVFHLQANADVRHGLDHPTRDLEQNTIATSTVLEAMRAEGVSRIAFSSTGSIYGEPDVFPTPEDCPFPVQTSLYGASKLAAEGMIAAYCHGYGFTGTCLRFVSALGERYTHGHVFDFYRALQDDPTRLRILGDGRQRKSYMYVGDCVDGILAAVEATAAGTADVFNLGTDETISVDESVALITSALGVTPELEHTGGERGWPGDSPLIHLDCSKLRAAGWTPAVAIPEAIERTVAWLDANAWVFEGAGARSE
jgi:UDP-glucose 4-epimerase